MDGVTHVRVVDILKNVEGSCDFDEIEFYPGDDIDEQRTAFWQDVIEVKSSDTGFGHLVESILEYDFVPEGPIGWYQNRITEGHHRLVAAILLCLDTVPVSEEGEDWYTFGTRGIKKTVSAHSDDDHYPIPIEF